MAAIGRILARETEAEIMVAEVIQTVKAMQLHIEAIIKDHRSK